MEYNYSLKSKFILYFVKSLRNVTVQFLFQSVKGMDSISIFPKVGTGVSVQ